MRIPALDVMASAVEPDTEDRLSWRDQAACRGLDTEMFFPDAGDDVGTERARQVCGRCPVAWACLSYAVWTNQTDGIWGGATRGERRSLRRLFVREMREAG